MSQKSCPAEFTEFQGSCYRWVWVEDFLLDGLVWTEAGRYCNNFGKDDYDVHLVTIESKAEMDFIANTTSNTPGKGNEKAELSNFFCFC